MPADLTDRTDFENANRGLVARLEPGVITAADGRVVYDADEYTRATTGDCPDTVDPSLWRQSQLTAIQGLFEVTDGIYQLRGIELSNMTLIEGDTGVIVIDPAVSAEVAAAGIALYRTHRGERPVTAVIYTHSHIDHFGGVLGVVDADTDVPIVAPAGFLEHAVSENVYAGNAMLRRGMYHTGMGLPVSGTGTIGVGLGPGTSKGTVGLIAPTVDITHTGQQETLDGVRIDFQITPGTEAPSEMNFHFPDKRTLCLAENVTHNLHNILTLRGAEVRDARNWSRYIDEAIDLFADGTDVAFASHHWPTWGADAVVTLMTQQRDLYAFLHDQTLRLMNQGLVGSEIAEVIEMPPALEAAWHTHGYYGSVSHNVKAIYQRYLGWYDGNPAHLWQHPPEAAASRYVRIIGGVDATVTRAQEFADAGDLRFAAELASHAVFAEPDPPGRKSPARRRVHPSRLRVRVRHLAQQLPDRRAGARRPGRDGDGQLGRHGLGPDHHPAVRQPRHPHRREAVVGRHGLDPLALHRHRRDLPDGALQRGAHPPPDHTDTARRPRRHTDEGPAAGDARRREPGRRAVRGRPEDVRRDRGIHRRPRPGLRHRDAVGTPEVRSANRPVAARARRRARSPTDAGA